MSINRTGTPRRGINAGCGHDLGKPECAIVILNKQSKYCGTLRIERCTRYSRWIAHKAVQRRDYYQEKNDEIISCARLMFDRGVTSMEGLINIDC